MIFAGDLLIDDDDGGGGGDDGQERARSQWTMEVTLLFLVYCTLSVVGGHAVVGCSSFSDTGSR